MTLARYTASGRARHDLRRRRLRDRAVLRHADERRRQQRRHRHDHRRRRQHHRRRVRRVAVDGRRALHRQRRLQRRSRLLRAAPDRLHRPRDRHARNRRRARRLRPRSPCVGRGPADRAGRRCTASARSSRSPPRASARRPAVRTPTGPTGLSLGSAGVQIDGLQHDGTVVPDLVSQAGRWYDGVAATATSYIGRFHGRPGRRLVGRALRGRRCGHARRDVQRCRRGTGTRRARRTPTCTRSGRNGTDVYVAGESIDATAANRRMLVARITTTGAMGGFGSGGIALARVAGGNNSGQAFVFQGTNIIVGGSANLAGKAALGLVRLERGRRRRRDVRHRRLRLRRRSARRPSTASSPAWPLSGQLRPRLRPGE